MRILAKYSFANGQDYVNDHFSHLLNEIEEAIGKVDASECLIKKSKEKTMPGNFEWMAFAFLPAMY